MIVNKIKTMAVKTGAFVFAVIMISSQMTVGVFAYTDFINRAKANNISQTAPAFNFELSSYTTDAYEPITVTLVNRTEVSTSQFFPVLCSEFLQYQGIVLGQNDVLNVSPDTKLYDGIVVNISTVEYVTETRTENVPFEVIEFDSQTVPKGETEIVQEGIDGKAERSYIVKYVNGVETQRALYDEKIITAPVEQTVNKGVGGVVTAKDGTQYRFTHYKVMEATAYTYVPGKTTMTTATGETLRKGIVAVDPKVIPMHTKMFIASDTVEYGLGQAEDTGGVIKGNIVDLAYMSYDECIQFGRRNMRVYFLED